MSYARERVVCLSAESADWIWRIGAWEHVVGVTAFFDQPLDLVSKPLVSGLNEPVVKTCSQGSDHGVLQGIERCPQNKCVRLIRKLLWHPGAESPFLSLRLHYDLIGRMYPPSSRMRFMKSAVKTFSSPG